MSAEVRVKEKSDKWMRRWPCETCTETMKKKIRKWEIEPKILENVNENKRQVKKNGTCVRNGGQKKRST